MPKKQYASGRTRQQAAKAKRTRPRVVVTMEEPKKPKGEKKKKAAKVAAKVEPKEEPKPKRKPHGRRIPKDVTPKPKPKTRKVPRRKQASVKPLVKPAPKKPMFGKGTVEPGYEEIHPILTRLGVTRRKKK